jgi:hypothetical protein
VVVSKCLSTRYRLQNVPFEGPDFSPSYAMIRSRIGSPEGR